MEQAPASEVSAPGVVGKPLDGTAPAPSARSVEERLTNLEAASSALLLMRAYPWLKPLTVAVAVILFAALGWPAYVSLPKQVAAVDASVAAVDGRVTALKERASDLDDRMLRTERRAGLLDESVARSAVIVERAEKSSAEAMAAETRMRKLTDDVEARAKAARAELEDVVLRAESAGAQARGALVAMGQESARIERLLQRSQVQGAPQVESRSAANEAPYGVEISGSGNGVTLSVGYPASAAASVSGANGTVVVLVPRGRRVLVTLAGSGHALFIPKALAEYVTVSDSGALNRVQYY